MKILVSTLLLIALLFSTVGMMVILHVQKKAIRRQVKQEILAGIDKNRLFLLKFSKKEQQQLLFAHTQEFEYEGNMYDIVFEEHFKDSVWYWCWKDDAETALNRQLNMLLASAFAHHKPLQQHTESVFYFYKNLFFQTYSICVITQSTQLYSLSQLCFYRAWKAMFAPNPPFHPPNFVCQSSS